MAKIKVFLDSDVVISAVLSSKGASYEVINNPEIDKFISKGVVEEVKDVALRLSIPESSITKIFKNFKLLQSVGKKEKIVNKYAEFVNDLEDAHIIAAADILRVRFLLTFNSKHYRVERIKNELGILVIKPGFFLQYLRSRR